MKRIIFFAAGSQPTSDELASIATLNAQALQPYEVIVMNGASTVKYGQDNILPCDYVVGTAIPTAYNAKPVYDPAKPPTPPSLPATQAIVNNGVDMVIPLTGVYATKLKLTIANNVVTGAVAS